LSAPFSVPIFSPPSTPTSVVSTQKEQFSALTLAPENSVNPDLPPSPEVTAPGLKRVPPPPASNANPAASIAEKKADPDAPANCVVDSSASLSVNVLRFASSARVRNIPAGNADGILSLLAGLCQQLPPANKNTLNLLLSLLAALVKPATHDARETLANLISVFAPFLLRPRVSEKIVREANARSSPRNSTPAFPDRAPRDEQDKAEHARNLLELMILGYARVFPAGLPPKIRLEAKPATYVRSNLVRALRVAIILTFCLLLPTYFSSFLFQGICSCPRFFDIYLV
jgi:hypothetical protein